MKILHIIDAMGVGGAERLLEGVIRGLNEHEHHLILVHGPDDLARDLGCPTTILNCPGLKSAVFKAHQVRRYISEHGIDMVHSHLYLSTIVARLATPSEVPLISSIHNIPSLDFYAASRVVLWLDQLTYRSRHHIITVSQAVLDDFRRRPGLKGRATVLYNYVEDAFFEKGGTKTVFRTDTLKLVSVGNLRATKNHGFALEAIKRTKGCSLDIFGEGELRPGLEQQIQAHRLPVYLKGLSNGLADTLPGYDLFLTTSLYEGFGISIVEAMAAGLPLLLPDAPIYREVSAGNALFFDLADPGSLVKVLDAIQDGKVNLEALSSGGRRRAEQFRKSNYLSQLRTIYTN